MSSRCTSLQIFFSTTIAHTVSRNCHISAVPLTSFCRNSTKTVSSVIFLSPLICFYIIKFAYAHYYVITSSVQNDNSYLSDSQPRIQVLSLKFETTALHRLYHLKLRPIERLSSIVKPYTCDLFVYDMCHTLLP